jgi:hypothetical protein
MRGKWQFSIGYLLLLILWWALALGFTRQYIYVALLTEWKKADPWLALSALCWGPAIGGLFLKMKAEIAGGVIGVVFGYLLSLIS